MNFPKTVTANLIPVAAAVACFPIGWHLKTAAAATGSKPTESNTRSGRERRMPPLVKQGSQLLEEWNGRLGETPEAGIEDLANALLQDSHRQDPALWAPLLARWSATDGPGMIAFVEKISSPALRLRLLEDAWFAWGASDPDAAFKAGGKLPPTPVGMPPTLLERLLDGIAETDPVKAAEYAVQVPGSQFVMSSLAARIAGTSPELAAKLLQRAVYDGGRFPFERARVSQLAATDPAGAVAYARSRGNIGIDPIPGAVEAIAKNDPLQAAAQVAAMPSSRSKALSSVDLARSWAARDPEAAVKWIRESLTGPVLHHALIAAAAAAGSGDPAKSLDLIGEAGWEDEADFFSIRESRTMKSFESGSHENARAIVLRLLQQWSLTDPEAAKRYLTDRIPEEFTQKLTQPPAPSDDPFQ